MVFSKSQLYATAFVLLLFLGGGGYIVGTQSSRTQTPTGGEEKPTPEAFYTLEEVAQHDSEDSCWVAISGKVYDLTEWIGGHPGGERAILSICGIDGTQTFTGMHGGQAQPESALATFIIGVLKEE